MRGESRSVLRGYVARIRPAFFAKRQLCAGRAAVIGNDVRSASSEYAWTGIDSGQDLRADLRLPLGADEALLQALIRIAQLPGVEPHQVQDGCLQVGDGRLPFGDEVAQFVGGAEDRPPLDPGP